MEWNPEDHLEHFRALLKRTETELVEAGNIGISPNRGEGINSGDDEDEQPLNEMLQAIASRRNLNRTQILKQVRAALRLLQEDPEDYGYCASCDALIPRGRLEARPYARLCVACQDAQDDPIHHKRRKITDYI